MKTLKYLLIVLTGLLLFAACQKEYSSEIGGNGFATGSLKNVLGDCTPKHINGTYQQDSTLTDSNYVTIQVNFTSPGSYNIFTDTVNGFFFRDSAFIIDTGLQTIKLKGLGRAILSKTTDFVVTFDTSFCTFSVPVISAVNAVYTLVASGNSCSNSNVAGSYQAGTTLDASNLVSTLVNVTQIGGYSITAGPVNGMTFTSQGNFTSTGQQTITLSGSGTPTVAGTTTIPLIAGSSSCRFVVSVTANTGTNPSTSSWSFNQGTSSFSGPLDPADLTTIPGFGTGIAINGQTAATGDSNIAILITLPGSTIQPGTYTTKTIATLFTFDGDATTTIPIYSANTTTTSSVITIIITSYDATTKVLTGTFSGNAKNASGASVPITNGKFTTVVN